MLFGHKSPIKNHLSAKHPTHTHHVVVKAAQERTDDIDREMESSSSERNPTEREEMREPMPIRQ